MGFTDGVIDLDTPTGCYFPGQTIFGTVKFSIDHQKTFRGIYVKVKGQAHVHWTKTRGSGKSRRTVHYNADEEYFNMKIYLVGAESGDHSLPPGEHKLPFQYTIPATCPTSFEGKLGYVRYSVKAVVDQAFKLDQKLKATFRVIAPLDLNLIPDAREPISIQVMKTFTGFFCTNLGFCETIVKLPATGVVPGQTLPIEVTCNNKSEVIIESILLTVVEETSFYADVRRGSRHFKSVVAQLPVEQSVPENSTRNFALDFKFPMMEVINLAGCRIINISYTFKVKIFCSGCHSNAKETVSIILGTVPLTDTPTQYQISPETMATVKPVYPPSADPKYSPFPPNPYPPSPVPSQRSLTQYPGSTANPPNPLGHPSSLIPRITVENGYSSPPGGNSPYPGENSPYPGGNSPYPVGNSAYPVTPAPNPNGNPTILGSAPHSPNVAPYPLENSPCPSGNAPNPAGNAPYPAGNAPYPAGNAPYPAGIAPYPAGNAPYPAGIAPYPAGNAPYPAGIAPYPAVNAPYPAGNAPYPSSVNPMPMPLPYTSEQNQTSKYNEGDAEVTMPLLPKTPAAAITPINLPTTPCAPSAPSVIVQGATPTSVTSNEMSQPPYNPNFVEKST